MKIVADQQRFRADLYYRLAGFPIHLPALRERRDDIPALVEHVVAQASAQQGKRVVGMTPKALEQLLAYAWPGNVRELQNELGRAVVMVRPGGSIETRHPSARLRRGADPGDTRAPTAGAELRAARSAFERAHIADVLDRHGGNITHAARALGPSRFMLQRKLKEYGLR